MSERRRERAAFAAAVRAVRERRRMTRAELARASGLSRACVARIEDGPANPTFHTIVKLAAGLDVQPSELMPGGGDE